MSCALLALNELRQIVVRQLYLVCVDLRCQVVLLHREHLLALLVNVDLEATFWLALLGWILGICSGQASWKLLVSLADHYRLRLLLQVLLLVGR